MERKEIEILELLKRMTQFFELDEINKIVVYAKALAKQFSTEEVKIGLNSVIENRKYPSFPNFAEIREYCLSNDYKKRYISDIIEVIKKAVLTYGYVETIKFEDKNIENIISKIGWSKICLMEEEEFEKKVNELFFKNELNEQLKENDNEKINVIIKKRIDFSNEYIDYLGNLDTKLTLEEKEKVLRLERK